MEVLHLIFRKVNWITISTIEERGKRTFVVSHNTKRFPGEDSHMGIDLEKLLDAVWKEVNK